MEIYLSNGHQDNRNSNQMKTEYFCHSIFNSNIHKIVTFIFSKHLTPHPLNEPADISFCGFFVLCLKKWFKDRVGSVDFIQPKMKALLFSSESIGSLFSDR